MDSHLARHGLDGAKKIPQNINATKQDFRLSNRQIAQNQQKWQINPVLARKNSL